MSLCVNLIVSRYFFEPLPFSSCLTFKYMAYSCFSLGSGYIKIFSKYVNINLGDAEVNLSYIFLLCSSKANSDYFSQFIF